MNYGVVKCCIAVAAVACFVSVAHAGEYEVGQQGKSFVRNGEKVDKLQVEVGSTVKFRNMDPFFHNVFSLSDAKMFDLGSYPQGEYKTVEFGEPGTVEVECAIHPQMFVEIEVK